MIHEPQASVSAVFVYSESSRAYFGVLCFPSLINIQQSGAVYSQAALS